MVGGTRARRAALWPEGADRIPPLFLFQPTRSLVAPHVSILYSHRRTTPLPHPHAVPFHPGCASYASISPFVHAYGNSSSNGTICSFRRSSFELVVMATIPFVRSQASVAWPGVMGRPERRERRAATAAATGSAGPPI